MNEIAELTRQIKKFRDERDWQQFHNHKDMALGNPHGVPDTGA